MQKEMLLLKMKRAESEASHTQHEGLSQLYCSFQKKWGGGKKGTTNKACMLQMLGL